MHYWTCITVQTWNPFKAFKEESGKIQMNGSRQTHLCFKGCLWLPENNSNIDLHQLYVLVHLPALPTPLQECTWPSGGQRSRRYTHCFCVPASCASAQPNPWLERLVSRLRRSTDAHWELPLGPVSFWTRTNFGSLTFSGKEFLRVPQIFTALGSLRENQIFSHSFWIRRISGPLLDGKSHRGIVPEAFSKGRKGWYQKFRWVTRLLITCIHL